MQRLVDADGHRLPYQTHFSHVEVSSTYDIYEKKVIDRTRQSNFVVVVALFDTIDVPVHLKP